MQSSPLFPLLLAVAAAAPAGCSHAKTLGDEPPPEVALPARPTYANGVGLLLELKCAYCHTSLPSDLKPSNAPADLDLSFYATTLTADLGAVRGADAIGRWIFDGVFDHPISNYQGGTIGQMPLDYGTQLTAAEKAGLLAWSNAGSPLDGTPAPTGGDPNAGKALFEQLAPSGFACASCHDAGEGIAGKGPQIRVVGVTPTKVKEMWLVRTQRQTPLSDQEALDLSSYVRSLPGLLQ